MHKKNSIEFFDRSPRSADEFASAVSLHSHTFHSVERLTMIPGIIQSRRWLSKLVAALEDHYLDEGDDPIDYSRLYFAPPLPPIEAHQAESAQIEHQLNLKPLVSLTDHDSLDAGLMLRASKLPDVPMSVEWTVPLGASYVHIGVHNLPPASALAIGAQMREVSTGCHACESDGTVCTGKHRFLKSSEFADTCGPRSKHRASFGDLLAYIAAFDDVLIVFNHPVWDTCGLDDVERRRLIARFLAIHGEHIHALELNGLRPWAENKATIDLSWQTGIPLVSGGDRHGCDPAAMLNLSHGETFADFVGEIRRERSSHVVVMPQYAEPLQFRMLQTAWDILREYPDHSYGKTRWTDRVFYRFSAEKTRSLSEIWAHGNPVALDGSMLFMQMLERWPFRNGMRRMFQPEEAVLA